MWRHTPPKRHVDKTATDFGKSPKSTTVPPFRCIQQRSLGTPLKDSEVILAGGKPTKNSNKSSRVTLPACKVTSKRCGLSEIARSGNRPLRQSRPSFNCARSYVETWRHVGTHLLVVTTTTTADVISVTACLSACYVSVCYVRAIFERIRKHVAEMQRKQIQKYKCYYFFSKTLDDGIWKKSFTATAHEVRNSDCNFNAVVSLAVCVHVLRWSYSNDPQRRTTLLIGLIFKSDQRHTGTRNNVSVVRRRLRIGEEIACERQTDKQTTVTYRMHDLCNAVFRKKDILFSRIVSRKQSNQAERKFRIILPNKHLFYTFFYLLENFVAT